MFPVLHIHGQDSWHDPVMIVGNRDALEILRDAITRALGDKEQSNCNSFAADGEGYRIFIKVRDFPMNAEEWGRARLPYIDEIAGGDRTLEL